MGFDVPEKLLGSIHYSTKRLSVDAESLADPRSMPVEMAKKLLFTKFSHWRYEQEVRCFVTLETQDPETAMYFAPFSEELRLTTVIVGAQSNLSRKDVGEALGELAPFVEAFKARLAFRSFRVVRQRRSSLWV